MLFLIEYDRTRGDLITLERFNITEKSLAEAARLKLEIELNSRGVEREIVLLEAETEEALRRTHRRYFEGLAELATVPGGAD